MTKEEIKNYLYEAWSFENITNMKEWYFHELHYCCSRCGGSKISVRISFDPNTGEIMRQSNKSMIGWCYECDDICLITTKSNFKKFLTPYEK
jgi:hypothetical protein